MNNEQLQTLSNTDRTSWRRIAMVARFYYPRLRRQIICYPIVSLGVALLFWLLMMLDKTISAISVMSVLQYLIILGPIVFAFRNDEVMQISLPALGMEKALMIIIYCMVVLPILAMVPCQLVTMIARLDTNVITSHFVFNEIGVELSPAQTAIITVVGWMSICCETAACLWAVMAARRNRIVWGIVASFSISIIASVIGVVTGIVFGVRDAIAGIAPRDFAPADFAMLIIDKMGFSIYFLVPFSIVFIVLAWRAITHRQV